MKLKYQITGAVLGALLGLAVYDVGGFAALLTITGIVTVLAIVIGDPN